MRFTVFAALIFMLSAPACACQFYTTHPLLKGTNGLKTLTGEWVSMPTSVEPYTEIDSHFEISKNQKSEFILTPTADPESHCKLNSVEIDESQYLIQIKLPANLIHPRAGDEKTEHYSYVHVHRRKDQLRFSQLDGSKFSAHLKSEKVEHQIFKDALLGHRIHGETERMAAELTNNIRKFTIDEEKYCHSDQLESLLQPLKTCTTTDSDGYESYSEYTWYDDAVAIVESEFNMFEQGGDLIQLSQVLVQLATPQIFHGALQQWFAILFQELAAGKPGLPCTGDRDSAVGKQAADGVFELVLTTDKFLAVFDQPAVLTHFDGGNVCRFEFVAVCQSSQFDGVVFVGFTFDVSPTPGVLMSAAHQRW